MLAGAWLGGERQRGDPGHHLGRRPDPRAAVDGADIDLLICATVIAPAKWGITIHNTHYGLVSDNVLYNYAGALLTTEDGSESFNVIERNFATRSSGKLRELSEILLLPPLPGPLAAPTVVLGLQGVLSDRQHDRSELVGDLPLQDHPLIGQRLLQDVVQDSGDDRDLIAVVARQDDGDIGGVGQVVHSGAFRGDGPIVLGGECKRVIDPIGVAVHSLKGGKVGKVGKDGKV